MRSKNLTLAQRKDILTRVLAGEKPKALAEEYGVTRSTIYGIRHSAGKSAKRLGVNHIELQRQSMTPPEVYCHRAGIRLSTLRSYGTVAACTPALASITERRKWWRNALAGVTPKDLVKACKAHNWPLPDAARWLADRDQINGTWLYGFYEPVPVPLSQQAIRDLQTDEARSDFVLINGRDTVYCPESLALHILEQHTNPTRKVA